MVLNLDHWFRRKCHLKILSRALAAQNVLQRTIFGEGKYELLVTLGWGQISLISSEVCPGSVPRP